MKKVNKSLITAIFLLIFFTGSAAKAQMFWNQAASFEGNSTSYVAVPSSSSVDLTGSFTIEAWVNPSNTNNKGIISKGGLLGTSLKYAIRITSSRVSIITNGSPRLSSKSTSLVPINTWTHVSATYNSSTGSFKIYLNGSLDSSSVVAGASPTSNTDSLYIGISGASTPFIGQLDEVRLWNRELSGSEVNEYFRTSMAEVSGIYNGMVLSMTFQDENSLGSDFNTRDISGNGNNGNLRNITPVNQSNVPYTTIFNNESVFLNGSNSYITGKDTSTLDASAAVTLECWVYQTSNSACNYISKGAASQVYSIGWNGLKVTAKINNTFLNVGNPIVPLNRWTHLAFVYSNSGPYNLFLNGVPQFGGFSALGNISNSSDSLYIGGGSGSLPEMTGYIDEVRITKDYSKSKYEVLTSMYNSQDAGNDPDPSFINISYNLDGLLVDNGNNGGPKLRFVGSARFSHPGSTASPTSPLTRDESNNFSKGYYIRTSLKPFNLAGSSVIMFDTININQNVTISDLNLFVALNHDAISNLDIVLIAPNGDSVKVFSNFISNSFDKGLVTLFDDQADSSLSSSHYTTFSPVFKPVNPMNSVFAGDKSQGKWIIKITDNNDNSAVETGVLYAWGFQLNNQSETKLNLNIGAIMQGFYNPVTDLMIRDTMRIYIRQQASPFALLDSSITFLDNTGLGLFDINAHLLGTGIQVQLKHRNSIETWASAPGIFLQNSDMTYLFNVFDSRAFGNNETQVDNSPTQFAIYGGDVNNDRFVDLSDIIFIFNDASNFVSGYVQSDITGDNNTDLNDIILAFNNSNDFVGAITP